MQAGLSRAIPMAILGFMFGALLVILIRGLQGLDPIWAAGPGIVISVITTAAFFVWGIGAFDPRLSIHGEEALEETVHEELAEEAAEPRSLLVGSTWQIVTALLIFLVILGGFAVLPGGLGLTQTVTPGASTAMVGFTAVQLPFGGPEVQVSTLVVFAIFVILAFISLIAAAGAIGYVIYFMSRGVTEVRTAGAGTAALPALAPTSTPEPVKRDKRETFVALGLFVLIFLILELFFYFLVFGVIFKNPQLPVLSALFDAPTQRAGLSELIALALAVIVVRPEQRQRVLTFFFTFVILYWVFFFVAIGLIFPQLALPVLSWFFDSPTQLIILSLVNAVLFTLIILETQLVMQVIGIVAEWLAYVLRRVPHFLQ